MKFYFCENCGKRLTENDISAGQARDKKLRGVYCESCADGVMTMEDLPLSNEDAKELLNKTGSAGRTRTDARSGRRRTGARATARGSRETGTDGRSEEKVAPPSSNTGLFIGGGAAGLAVGVLLIFLLSGPSDPPKQKRKSTAKKSSSRKKGEKVSDAPVTTKPVGVAAKSQPAPKDAKPTPPSTKVATKPTTPVLREKKEDPAFDPREGFAQRQWKAILALAADGKTHPYEARKKVEEFAKAYGSTKAGKAAQEKLKTMPKVDPPPPPPPPPTPQEVIAAGGSSGDTKITFYVMQDKDEDASHYKNGTKDTDVVYNDKKFSWRSTPVGGPWFTAKLGFSFGGKKPTLGKDSWLRVAYKLEGTNNVCFHSHIGGANIFERHVHNLVKGKWAWLTLKMSDYKRNIRNGPAKPTAGMQFHSTAILAGMRNKPCKLWLGPVMFGEGPVPKDP